MNVDARTGPFFSIVIPTYQRAHLIRTAVESVQAQTFTDWELIIIDDGSSDGTAAALSPLLSDTRIRYHWQPNAGRSAARNEGIGMATGHYVCFLDSDDMWLPDHLEVLHRSCCAHPGPAIHHTGLLCQWPDGSRKELDHFSGADTPSPVERVFRCEISPITSAISAELLKTDRFDTGLSVNEDLELFARLSVQCTIWPVREFTAVMRITGNNTTDYQHDYIDQMERVLQKLLRNPATAPHISAAFIQERRKTLAEWRIRNLEKAGSRWPLIRSVVSFILRYPQQPRNTAKLVMLLYALPGGGLFRKAVSRVKRI